MVAISMSLMLLKVIRKEVCLQGKSPSCYQRIMDPRGAQTFEGKRKSKEIKNLVKVEKGGVHYKKYDGSCMK